MEFAARGVDDEGHVLVLHQVDDVRALAAGEFGKGLDGDSRLFDDTGGVEGEAEIGVERSCANDVRAVGFSLTLMKKMAAKAGGQG